MIFSLRPKRKVLSMDIGAHKIKIVEGSNTKNGIQINNFLSIETPEGSLRDGIILDKDLMHYVISEELRNKKIKTKDVYLTINSSKIVTREIVIPKVEYDEIDKILKYQIEDYLPINVNDYIIQFKIIEGINADDIEKLRILVIAIQKNIIDDYYELVRNLNLNPIVLDYQPNSISKLLKYNSVVNNTFPLQNLTIASIDIGYDSTKISIIKNGNVLVTKIVEIAGKYIDESILNLNCNDENLGEIKNKIININHSYDDKSNDENILSILKSAVLIIAEKIEAVFRYYLNRKTDNKINMIILSGGISNINGLDNLFGNIFNIPTININSLDSVWFKGSLINYANAIGSIIREY